MLADGGAASSRERRVLLWAELTDATSLLIRRAEDAASTLSGPRLLRAFATKCLRTKQANRRQRERRPARRFLFVAMETWVDGGRITSGPPGLAGTGAGRTAAASPGARAPAGSEPTAAPS